jgi:HAD superfamily hydrolase (TIGR01509 family)
VKLRIAAPGRTPLELDTTSSHWQVSLDAAQRALSAAAHTLPSSELARRQRELAQERRETAEALAQLAKVTGVRPLPWLSPVPVTGKMLGLPATIRACLFDLDGVLTDSATLHASAWGEVFDRFMMRLCEKTGWQFIPFDREADYRAYIDGRPRLEGVHTFLDSRGIRLPEGRVGEPPNVDTATNLARQKGEALARGLRQHGVNALPGARRYLEAAGHADIKRAVVSASASTLPMLELAGLATVVDHHLDANLIRAESLRSRPAPDLPLAACRRLGLLPQQTVTFTHSAAGIAAARGAGMAIIGVGEGTQAELLAGLGADQVVPCLDSLLDPHLRNC